MVRVTSKRLVEQVKAAEHSFPHEHGALPRIVPGRHPDRGHDVRLLVSGGEQGHFLAHGLHLARFGVKAAVARAQLAHGRDGRLVPSPQGDHVGGLAEVLDRLEHAERRDGQVAREGVLLGLQRHDQLAVLDHGDGAVVAGIHCGYEHA